MAVTSATSLILSAVIAFSSVAVSTAWNSVSAQDANEKQTPSNQIEKQTSQQPEQPNDITSLIKQLMASYPECGPSFEEAIMSLVIASPQSAPKVLQALPNENNQSGTTQVKGCHSKSIGKALAKAMVQLSKTDLQSASFLTGLIAQSGNQNLQSAFLTVTGDQTAAVGDNNSNAAGGTQQVPAGLTGNPAGVVNETGSTAAGSGNTGSGTGTAGGFPSSTGGGGGGVSPSN